jgi:hypothetical protein
MATKFINVVYKVDDSQLSKAKASIQSVQTATKQAEQAMTSASAATARGGLQISQTYEGQRLQLAQLKAQIDLTKQSDTARLNQLKSDYAQVKSKVDEFNKSMQDTSQAGQFSLGIFQNLGATIAAAFSVAAVKQITSAYIELNKLAGQVEGVRVGFNKAFPNSSALLDQLRKSTHGVVTDFELMKQAVQANNLGIPIEHLGKLLEFAATRAQQTGQSVEYLVDSIQKGIGRKSILFFDQLGISTTRLKEEMGGLAIRSQTVGDVSAAVVKVANEELSKMGGYVETSATKVDQLNVAWETLRQTLGKKLESSGIIQFMTDFVNNRTAALKTAKELRDELVERLAGKDVSRVDTANKNEIQDQIKKREQLLEVTNRQIDANVKAAGLIISKGDQDALDKKNAGLLLQNDVLTKSIQILNDYSKVEKKRGDVEQQTAEDRQKIRDTETDTLLEGQKKEEEIDRQREEAVNASIKYDEYGNEIKQYNNEEHYQKVLKDLQDSEKQKENERKLAAETELRQENEKNAAIEAAQKQHEDHMKQLKQAGINYGLTALDQILSATLINRDYDTQSLNDYYQAQLDAAGDNERAKKDIQEKQTKAQQAQRLAQAQQDAQDAITKIEIDTAVGIIRALITPPVPNFGLAGIVAGAGIIQAATVRHVNSRSLATRAFAKGEVDIDGPGPKGIDSIHAMIAPGESVINHSATQASKNLLEAINERKIDDRILAKLAGDGGRQIPVFDDSGIIKAIEQNKTDYIQQGYSLMKVERKGANFRRTIRSKIQGY